MSTAFEGLDKGSIVTPRARSGNPRNMSWSSMNRQDGFVLAVPEDYAKLIHRLQRFQTPAIAWSEAQWVSLSDALVASHAGLDHKAFKLDEFFLGHFFIDAQVRE